MVQDSNDSTVSKMANNSLYSCSECNKTFATPFGALLNNMSCLHLDAENCVLCDKSFGDEVDISVHMLSEHGLEVCLLSLC